MPARTRKSNVAPPEPEPASPTPVESEDESNGEPHTDQPSKPGLQFSQTLSWRVGRPIPLAELLKRLQALAGEMRDLSQEEDEDARSSFTTVAKELADPQLLGHKDKGVRAWVACCAVDVLRLCAPDAPFTEKQLKVRTYYVTKT